MTIAGNAWTQTASFRSREDMDRALVAAAQAGSDAAFEKLHALHARSIYRITLSITKNPSDAEDAMQESFLRAYVALQQFRKEASFYSWLVRIAINSSLMLLRKRRWRQEFSMESYSDSENNVIPFDFVDSRPTPEVLFDIKEGYAHLERSLKVLPRSLRTAAELRFLHERSIHEISGVLGISAIATKTRLHRARKLMASRNGLKRGLKQRSA